MNSESETRPIPKSRFRRYDLKGDWIVLVGKSELDNDYLSLEFAQAGDFWFHAAKVAGAHTLLLKKEGIEPDKEILREAAALAAYHSKARNSKGKVEVSLTQAQWVTKPKRAPAGTVCIAREKTIFVGAALPNTEQKD